MERDYPDRPIVAVGAVVWKDDQVLLVQRGKPPQKGSWSLPGGAVELGERVFDAAAREVAEETGADIDIKGIIDVIDSIHTDSDGRIEYHYTLVDVAAVWVNGDIAAAADVTAAKWFTMTEISAMALWSETLCIIKKSKELI